MNTTICQRVLACALCLNMTVGGVWAASAAEASTLDTDMVGRFSVSEGPEGMCDVAPDVEAPSGMLVTQEGRVLWSRESDERRAMASTTKIMTALVAIEEGRPLDVVTVSSRAAGVRGSGASLISGEKLTLEELLTAMMLQSANDAAVAVAEHVGGSLEVFVAMMNARAEELGLADTHFENPHGLDEPEHFTTAADLAHLARTALEDAAFSRLVASEVATISGPWGERRLENSNDLLGDLAGVDGVKTGWTDDAGYCLVASAGRDDIELVTVVLGTESESDRFAEARTLLTWGFAHYRPRTLSSADETVGVVPVADYLDREVVARIGQGVVMDLLDLEGEVWRQYELAGTVDAPVLEGDTLGSLQIHQGDELLAEVPLVAAESVPAPTFWQRVRIFLIRTWRSIVGVPSPEPAV